MQLSCTPPRSRNNRLLRWCLQVPAVKRYYKSLSVLPQDRLFDPDVVKLYLVLFSSLISKPDLSSAHRDPIFYCEHKKGGMCMEEWCRLLQEPRAGVPSLVEMGPESSPCWSGSCEANYQFEKWFLFSFFLGLLSRPPPPPYSPIGPVKEGSTLLYVHSLPSPGFRGCPLGTSQQLPFAEHLTTWNLDWLKPTNSPPWNLRMPWGPPADFINLVSHCKSHSCRVAGTSAWFYYSLYTKRKLTLKVSKTCTLPVSACIILPRHGSEMLGSFTF